MYFAKFHDGRSGVLTTALVWDDTAGPLVPVSWLTALRLSGGLEAAFRAAPKGVGPGRVLLLSGPESEELELRGTVDRVASAGQERGIRLCKSAVDFDRAVAVHSRVHTVADPRGFSHGGEVLGCHFRLWPSVVGVDRAGCGYQINLRSHTPGAEDRREALKLRAKMGEYGLFSTGVRAVQDALAERATQPGFFFSEVIYFESEAARLAVIGRVLEHFRQTSMKLGFPEPPLQVGEFPDWVDTGRAELLEVIRHSPVAVRGSALLEMIELEMISEAFALDRARGAPACLAPRVFISYSSADSPRAFGLCDRLERAGIGCWIAPRNIDLGAMTYPAAISAAIGSAKALVVLESPSAHGSVHVPREVENALSCKLPIIALELAPRGGAGDGGLEYLLRTVHRTIGHGDGYSSAINTIVVRVRSVLGESASGI